MAETKLRRRLTWAIGLGALLIVAVLVVLAGPKRWSRWFESRREPLPGPAINALVSIDAGEIELGDFARFLQDFTGQPRDEPTS